MGSYSQGAIIRTEVSRESQPATQTRGPKKRTGTSKYDFFKVKVWLGENMDHYYILSRFLICRMLTVTKIPYIKAVKIALETKKYLVDNNLTDIKQAQLEDVLFSIIRNKGFDEQYIDCYRMVTQFYQSRQPLCIIICGTAWTGKSTIAQQLASRINIPNVMQTDVIYELLRAGADSPLASQPLWCKPGLVDTGLVSQFRREAQVVRKGMDGDLIKTLSDGKPIIIEGMHLDPGLYIHDFGQRGIIMLPARPTTALQLARPPVPQAAGRQYKRSFTSTGPIRDSEVAAEATADGNLAVDGVPTNANGAAVVGSGTALSRCVSADAELPVAAVHASALAAARPGPWSASHSTRTPATDERSSSADHTSNTVSTEGGTVGQVVGSYQQWQSVPQQQDSAEEQQPEGSAGGSVQELEGSHNPSGAAASTSHASSTVSGNTHRPTAEHDSSAALCSPSSKNSPCTAHADSSAGMQVHQHKGAPDHTAAATSSKLHPAGARSSSPTPRHTAVPQAASAPPPGSAALPSSPAHSCGSRHYSAVEPPVIMLDQLQVCAATAEAVALQQASQQQGQQRECHGARDPRPIVEPQGSEATTALEPCTSRVQQQHAAVGGPALAQQQLLQWQVAGSIPAVQQHLQPPADGDAAHCHPTSCDNSAPQVHQVGKERVQKPLFVPVLVYMDEADHALMQEEALCHLDMYAADVGAADTAGIAGPATDSAVSGTELQGEQDTPADAPAQSAAGELVDASSAGSPVVAAAVLGGAQVSAQEALRRMRLLQEYLCAYEAQGLPVVKVSYGNFGEALDKLHEYILQCIKVAMQL